MTKRKDSKVEPENTAQVRPSHGTHVNAGRCSDCAQGIIGKVRDGFEYFDQDHDGRGFWFCCYCGSNHVKFSTTAWKSSRAASTRRTEV